MVNFDLREVKDSIDLPDGRRVILLDRLGKTGSYSETERARNIFLLNDRGRVVWQVHSKFDSDGGPFTKLEGIRDGKLIAYRWDGGDYEINMETGFATPGAFRK